MSNLVNKSIITAISFLFVLVFSPVSSATENPFGLSSKAVDQMQLASKGKCGEGKCGGSDKKGKCGEGKCGGSSKKGKCGEGKCGGSDKKGKCGGSSKKGKCGEGKCGGS